LKKKQKLRLAKDSELHPILQHVPFPYNASRNVTGKKDRNFQILSLLFDIVAPKRLS
jgi:hypothetical protein